MMNADSPDVSDGYAKEDGGISPKLDAALDLLSNHRRRYVLYALRRRGGAVTLEELAEQVASWEDDGADEKRVRAALYHNQLPRLESAGVVALDPETNVVRLTSNDGSPLSEYLDLAACEENVA
ncbi:hypothetical protein NGM10_15235 [Halorussus salilacus]|uniref:DUF7344 domain-containing protein n=1 Tax=Halorussus salilacus TaxID=2953750 RepID=UPI00209F1CB0|nr:hypothetical protein [Halorussus salilacus]USZ68073.1 hypothetical protein NGM10_15235 [Halorussus salilacus]